jgi:hypothetical protein
VGNQKCFKIVGGLFKITWFIVLIFNANLSFAQMRFGPKVGSNISELPDNRTYVIGNQQVYGMLHPKTRTGV